MRGNRQRVPSAAYSQAYFLQGCDGHEEYARSGGRTLPRRLQQALSLAGDLAGRRVLDLGCGRGEVVRYCAEVGARVVGVDYAEGALAIAARTLDGRGDRLARADALSLPFRSESFDVVFALDIVEHLHPHELHAVLEEVHRVLASTGTLIVHTMPNIWYYRFGYPMFRLVQRLRGRRLPADPRERWLGAVETHVNEQSIRSLRRCLNAAGFVSRVKLWNTRDFREEGNAVVRRIMRVLATRRPFAYVFCNDLFATAAKEANRSGGALHG